ncbi:MAG: T9SS type A sorting domain-containing protein [Candidatus Zixiibacteriota bacterium]
MNKQTINNAIGKVCKYLFVCLILGICVSDVLSQSCDGDPDYFVFTDKTGDSYAIVIDSISSICGYNICQCDEIGVYDGDICVGASVFDGNWPLAITAWKDDTQTGVIDGYSAGNNIRFKIWQSSTNTLFETNGTYERGDGTFGNEAYAKLWLCDITLNVNENEYGQLPSIISLFQNYPNPFNPCTTIPFTLYKRAYIEIEILTLLGQKITAVVPRQYDAGSYEVTWNGRTNTNENVSSGIYLYRIRADQHVQTKMMVLIK